MYCGGSPKCLENTALDALSGGLRSFLRSYSNNTFHKHVIDFTYYIHSTNADYIHLTNIYFLLFYVSRIFQIPLPSRSLHPNEFTSEVDNKDSLGITPRGKTGDPRHQRLAPAEPSDLGIIRSPWWRRSWRTLGSVPFPQPHSQVGPPFCCIPSDALWLLSPVASSLHRYFKFTILGFKT